MSDDVSDPVEEYLRTTKSIETLSRLVQLTNEAKRKRYLQDEIDRLTDYRAQLAESFDLDTQEIEQEKARVEQENEYETQAGEYPVLFSFRDRYAHFADRYDVRDPEIRSVVVYVNYFEDECLPILDKKKVDLDHLSGLEMESFHNLFSQLKRRLEIFLSEADLYEGEGAKNLKKIKAKQVLLVEVYKFFKRIRGFCEELLEDIDGPQKLCFNGRTGLKLHPSEAHLSLAGSTVREAVAQIGACCAEAIDYLDIPSFRQ